MGILELDTLSLLLFTLDCSRGAFVFITNIKY